MSTLPGLTEAILPQLRPGDLLIYSRDSCFSKAVKLKTWSNYSHVETYLAYGTVHAARRGAGVGCFTIDYDGLVLVRRPEPRFRFDLDLARIYCLRVDGQRYDLFGTLRFFTIGEQSTDKQFCSEDATRLARVAGVEPFSARLDADLVSPRDLAFTPNYFDVLIYSGLDFEHDTPPRAQELV